MNCYKCRHMKKIHRFQNLRMECLCKHPNQEYIKKYYETHDIRRYLGFICYTDIKTDEPTTKTSPRWCPLKEKKE